MQGSDMSEVLISLHIEKLEEGGYLATSKDLPGLIAQGRTIAETIEIAQDVARKIIESHIEQGDTLPFDLKQQEAVMGKVKLTDIKIPVCVV